MNIAIDERTKHRLTGLVVIMAVAIIFVPAMLKKSNQRLEENLHVSVQLPPKPTAPKVAVAEEKKVFETVKVEKVALPAAIEKTTASQIARVENLTPKAAPKKTSTKPVAKVVPLPVEEPAVKPEAAPIEKQVASPVFVKKEKQEAPFQPKPVLAEQATSAAAYAVQLASFSVQQNAEKLVAELRSQGYKARYHTVTSEQGPAYKVTVGQLEDRSDARALKNKLTESTNIEGFIVKNNVG